MRCPSNGGMLKSTIALEDLGAVVAGERAMTDFASAVTDYLQTRRAMG